MDNVTAHPILFSAPMVLALLADRKTMTRRKPARRLSLISPGYRLWVRESGAFACRHAPIYRADGEQGGWKWVPSIHMPRWASRLTLIVTAKKYERLQDITNADAIAEGCGVNFDHGQPELTRETFPAQRFRDLWVRLHGVSSWDANPEVVAISFTVHKCNIDQLAADTSALREDMK